MKKYIYEYNKEVRMMQSVYSLLLKGMSAYSHDERHECILFHIERQLCNTHLQVVERSRAIALLGQLAEADDTDECHSDEGTSKIIENYSENLYITEKFV